MSETYPEDIMKAARAIAHVVFIAGPEQDDLADAVCRAILAERERCAKCCEGEFDYEMRGYGKAFAAMIRNAP